MWSQSEENRSIRRGVGLSENFRHEIPESGQSFFVYSLIFPTLTFTKNMNSPTNHNTSPVPSVSYLVHLKSDPGVATEGGEPGSFRYAHEHPSVIVHTGQRLDVDPVLTRECHSCRVAKIRADPGLSSAKSDRSSGTRFRFMTHSPWMRVRQLPPNYVGVTSLLLNPRTQRWPKRSAPFSLSEGTRQQLALINAVCRNIYCMTE